MAGEEVQHHLAGIGAGFGVEGQGGVAAAPGVFQLFDLRDAQQQFASDIKVVQAVGVAAAGPPLRLVADFRCVGQAVQQQALAMKATSSPASSRQASK